MFNGYDEYGGEYGGYGMGMGMGARGGGFMEQYRCYSVAMMQGSERRNVNYGGKIILPQSALAKLASLNIQYPMLFQLSRGSQSTHAGVLEFIAEEGRVYLPHWMMKTLGLSEGDMVTVKSAGLPLGSFVKIQPQSVDFLDISDPKAVLENALRNFSTLTQGDNLEISYNDKVYGILVMEIKPPGVGISIVETDLEVDFAAPLGYQEPTPQPRSRSIMESKMKKEVEQKLQAANVAKKSPFDGQGQRLNGSTSSSSKGKSTSGRSSAGIASPAPTASSSASIASTQSTRPDNILDHVGSDAPAALNLPLGQLYFGYKYIPPKSEQDAEQLAAAEAARSATPVFEGDGQTLRPPRPNRGSGASSPAPSIASSTGGGQSATPVPQPTPLSQESKPDMKPFQGKGNTMR